MTHPPIKYLQGVKVYLRPLEPHDVDQMYVSINNDLKTRCLTATQRAFTRQQIEDYIEVSLRTTHAPSSPSACKAPTN